LERQKHLMPCKVENLSEAELKYYAIIAAVLSGDFALLLAFIGTLFGSNYGGETLEC